MRLTLVCARRIWCPLVLVTIVLVAAAIAAQPVKEQSMIMFENLKSDQAKVRDQAVDQILGDRKLVIEQLIAQFAPRNIVKGSEQTRCVAAYLLGELRAVEAAPILARALAEPLGTEDRSDIGRYDSPVFRALLKIGSPAVPAVVANIKTSDDRVLRRYSLDVLIRLVGGKRQLLELLSKLNDRALAAGPADRDAAHRLREAHSWAESYYVETDDELIN